MLVEDIYTIIGQGISETEATFTLRFHLDHPIFKGHFPEQPIVPGAILTQIACNFASLITHQKMVLTSAKRIKFLNLILPDKTPEICYHLQWDIVDNQYLIKCSIHNEEIQFSQMTLSLQPQNEQ